MKKGSKVMTKNFLLIVEGEVTEKDILTMVFKRYGLNVYDKGKLNLKKLNITELTYSQFGAPSNCNIILVQGPKNRICDWLKDINKETDDFERYFQNLDGVFAGIFVIYDVDHTSDAALVEMFNKFNDETSNGLLLLSSPCIEVIADKERKNDLKVDHLKNYKSELNIRFNKEFKCSTKQFIINNFESLALYYLEKNEKELQCKNVMEHPVLILDKINELNERKFISADYQPVHYRYFTTVIYVCIAYIYGLTKEVENVETVRKFLLSHIKNHS